MTTTAETMSLPGRRGPPRPTAPSRLARARDVLAFEWTKLQSVRSNRWTLIAAVTVTLGVTVIVAESVATATRHAPFDSLTASFLGFAEYTVLPVTVLSVLVFTSEYSSGLIRTTFTAVPQRGSVLAAKTVVTGAAALVIGELVAVTCFLLTQAIVSGRHGGLSLSHPGVPRAILVVGLALAACAMVGVAAGAIIRHTAGAIAAAITVVYLLAVLCRLLPGPWNTRLGRFTMPYAAYQAVTLHPQAGMLSPGLSLVVVVAWPAIAVLAAAAVLTRRDV
jgi:ABC-2 type transport system permease protein